MIITRINRSIFLRRQTRNFRHVITRMNILRQHSNKLNINMNIGLVLLRRRFSRLRHFLKILNIHASNRRRIITNNRSLLTNIVNNQRLNRAGFSVKISRRSLQSNMNTRQSSHNLTLNRILHTLLMNSTNIHDKMNRRLKFLLS